MDMEANNGAEQTGWDYVIRPKRSWFEIDINGLWHYRDLCIMYVKRSFVTTYKQTILGPMWFIIQPVLTIIIYMFIFGGLAGISTEGIPQPLFYMAGILLWNYFTDCFNASSNVFVSNASVFEKVYFPRLIIPLSGILSCLFKLAIQLLLLIAIYIWCALSNDSFSMNWSLLLFPVLVFMTAFHGMSWGLLVSSVTYKYRDLQILVGFVIQLLMYATPVVYPLETIPDRYRMLVWLNPLTPILETFKHGCFNTGMLDWWGLLYSFVFMIVVTTGSVLLFNRVERNFMDCV